MLMRSFILLLIMLAPETGALAQNNSTYPNIIYILADDMGFGDVSAYNPEGKIKTPSLDKMANEGMMFTDAHTSSSVCTPTRYGILTGRYNWRSRLKSGVLTGNSKALIPDDRTTLASLLKTQGYKTAFIGKWHLGWNWALKNPTLKSGDGWDKSDFDNIDFTKPISHGPKELGFDYSYGHAGSLDMAPYVYVENGMATAQPNRITVNKDKYGWWREGPTAADFDHDDVTPNFFRKTIDYISTENTHKKPFFIYLALPSPHTPILPLDKWKGKSKLNSYGDFVIMIDHYIGQLMDTLKKEGIAHNTLIVFTTDNGCSPAAGFDEMVESGHLPNYIFRGHKADIFEGGHRVPFIVRWPSVISDNRKSNQLICTTDFLATVAEITGYQLKPNEGEDSFSMLPIFYGNDQKIRSSVVNHSINGSFAIRQDHWKLILTPDSGGWSYPIPGKDQQLIEQLPKFQLYDLAQDPGEQNNLYTVQPKKAQELQTLLVELIRNGRSTPGPHQENDPITKEWKQIQLIKQ